jgi:hypothetical protein
MSSHHLQNSVTPLAAVPNISLDSADLADCTILAAGPLVKQPGTSAFRTILVLRAYYGTDRPSELIVWTQVFPNAPDFHRSNCSQGNYFLDTELVDAHQAFATRLVNQSSSMASVYRE